MPRYQFALSDEHQVREAGVVQSETFSEALDAISDHVAAQEGDTLEVGVAGFPPARFHCVSITSTGSSAWLPAGMLAA